jgi:hypothetical protein
MTITHHFFIARHGKQTFSFRLLHAIAKNHKYVLHIAKNINTISQPIAKIKQHILHHCKETGKIIGEIYIEKTYFPYT